MIVRGKNSGKTTKEIKQRKNKKFECIRKETIKKRRIPLKNVTPKGNRTSRFPFQSVRKIAVS